MRSLNGWRHIPLGLGYHRAMEDFARESRYPMPVTRNMPEKHPGGMGLRYDFLFDSAVMDCRITRLFDFMAPRTQNYRFPEVLPELRKVQAHASLEGS